jgi:hypothetical protein
MSDGVQHERQRTDLGFTVIYLETEALVRSNWPGISVLLRNVFTLANLWGLPLLLPEPVEKQVEERWLRKVDEARVKLASAATAFDRLLGPLGTRLQTNQEPVEELLRRYRETVGVIKSTFKIQPVPFTTRPVADFFNIAVRYILPFECQGEGKGFQDAVILASVLDHLSHNPEYSGVLASADGALAKTNLDSFIPGCAPTRLKVLTLDQIGELLYRKYWDERVKAPWEEEQRNAMEAVRAKERELTEFIASRLSGSMLSPGISQKVVQVRGVDKIEIQYVRTPLPDPAKPDRVVKLAIAALAQCRAVVEENYSGLAGLLFSRSYQRLSGGLPPPPPAPKQTEESVAWIGGIEAEAEVVDRRFEKIRFLSLISSQELGEERWLREQSSGTVDKPPAS